MPLLALDTSTHTASVAVVGEDESELASRSSEVSTHSESLLILIDEALAEARVPLGDVSAIACGQGPGSFTGLRIGLATAKGLCFARSKPLLLVSSLAALARQVTPPALGVACMDARKGEVFLGVYDGDQLLAPERALAPGAVPAALAELTGAHGGSPVTLVGDAVRRYPELRALGTWKESTPRGLEVGRLALPRLRAGESDDLDHAAPRYIRPPEITQKKSPF